MRFYRCIGLMFVFFVIVSCKSDVKKEGDTQSYKKLENIYRVRVTLKSNAADVFKFVFVDEDRIETMVSVKVAKTNDFKTIEGSFKMKYDFEFPTIMYFGLGYSTPKEVTIEKIELSFNNKEVIYLPEEFHEFFNTNEYIKKGDTEGLYITQRLNNKLVPIFSAKKDAINAVK